MLSTLHIENIAVIESADISFHEGFHVLTGETGAGKSIIIDAISAILGERTYRDIIRTGADHGSVSAVFTDVHELNWFEENGIPIDDGEILIQRDIFTDGKNQCRVNGKPVTVSILRSLGKQLITIHGQHDSQQLFDESTHLSILDLFAGNGELRDKYTEVFSRVESIQREIKKLTIDESEKARKTETLKYQIDEIEKADLKPGEDEELSDRRVILSNAEKIAGRLDEAYAALNGGEDSDGALAALRQAEHALSGISKLMDSAGELQHRLSELSYQLDDVVSELQSLSDSLDYSDEELDRIEDRLDIIKKLKRKYGSTIEQILEFHDHALEEMNEIVFSDEKIEKLKKELVRVEKVAYGIAGELHENRLDEARKLETRISSELAALDMPKVKFKCLFRETDLSPDGIDNVVFLMSANIGEALKPLSKVASGGELARIMLAIKNVMAEKDSIDTLIFDEVDAGVSGRAAQKVAVKLKSVSKNKQVLCVSHLPQIAAAADIHLLISKEIKGERTYTSVVPLDREGRINEIARIIGGAVITEVTRKSAEEMLQ